MKEQVTFTKRGQEIIAKTLGVYGSTSWSVSKDNEDVRTAYRQAMTTRSAKTRNAAHRKLKKLGIAW